MKTSNEQANQHSSGQGNWWLVLAVVLLALLPLIFVRGEYGGADGEAEAAIGEIQPDIDQLKNISQIEHSRHRSPVNFGVNILCGGKCLLSPTEEAFYPARLGFSSFSLTRTDVK